MAAPPLEVLDDVSGDYASGAPPPSSPPPPTTTPTLLDRLLFYVGTPAAVVVVLSVCTVCFVVRRRHLRRQRIALLWQQHIQDTSGGDGSYREYFLDPSAARLPSERHTT